MLLSEYREMIQPSGTAHQDVGGKDIIIMPEFTMLVGEVISVDVERVYPALLPLSCLSYRIEGCLRESFIDDVSAIIDKKT